MTPDREHTIASRQQWALRTEANRIQDSNRWLVVDRCRCRLNSHSSRAAQQQSEGRRALHENRARGETMAFGAQPRSFTLGCVFPIQSQSESAVEDSSHVA